MSDRISRIICSIHHQHSGRFIETIRDLNPPSVFVESCRTVRRIEKQRPFGLPGVKVQLNDAPGDRFHITAPAAKADEIMQTLSETAEMDIPGHGSILIQNLNACTLGSSDTIRSPEKNPPLSQITCILSVKGSGEQMAGTALDLGTVVPTVTLGIGTGIRDRLGLLRITIPPQKELVHVTVPIHDAEGIIGLLIDHGKLDRPGGGFIYQTPADQGILDTRIRIGKQTHAASIEQIIAALDDLRGSTAWRKRFIEPGASSQRYIRNSCELIASCSEGNSSEVVETAMKAGAGGATISKVQRIGETESSAWERITIIVPSKKCTAVYQSLANLQNNTPEVFGCVEVLNVPLAYSYGG